MVTLIFCCYCQSLLFPLALLESAKAFHRLPALSWALQWAEASVLAGIPFISFKVTVVSSLEGIGKGRQFHALPIAKIILYFECVQRRSFSNVSTYKTLCKSWKVISAETRFPDSSGFLLFICWLCTKDKIEKSLFTGHAKSIPPILFL